MPEMDYDKLEQAITEKTKAILNSSITFVHPLKADVVWSYVANSDTDIQITNWRLRGKWIRTGLESHTPLREIDTDGFSWDVTSGSVIHSLWIQEHGFGEDRIELCKYIKAFKLLQPEINKAREYAEGIAEKPVLTWCSEAFIFGKCITNVGVNVGSRHYE